MSLMMVDNKQHYQKEINRLNLALVFDACPIGSEVNTYYGVGIVNGYRMLENGRLVISAVVQKPGADKCSIGVKPERLGLNLISDSELDPDRVYHIATNMVSKFNDTWRLTRPIQMSGVELQQLRKEAGLTQAAVAVYLGYKPAYCSAISEWETGKSRVPAAHYPKLLKLYKLAIEERANAAELTKQHLAEKLADADEETIKALEKVVMPIAIAIGQDDPIEDEAEVA